MADGKMMGPIHQVYRWHSYGEDGSATYWTDWGDGDRLTGRVVLENGVRLTEVEHTEEECYGFWGNKRRKFKRLALYPPEHIRYLEIAPPHPSE